MRRTGTGRCHPYLVWVDATPDGSNTLISAYLLLYDDDYYSYDERDKALTSHWKGKMVGDLISGGPAASDLQSYLQCTSRLVGDSDRALPQSLHTYRHPASLDRPVGTALTLPGTSTIEPLYLPASCTIEWSANSPPHSPSPDV